MCTRAWVCLTFFLISCVSGHVHFEQHETKRSTGDKRQMNRHRGLSKKGKVGKSGGKRHKGKANKPFVFDGEYFPSSEAFGETNKNCGTPDLPPGKRYKAQREADEFMKKKFGSKGAKGLRRLQTTQQIVINTYVHVVYRISDTDPSNVSESMILKQIKVLNDAFSGTPEDYTDCTGMAISGVPTPFRFNLLEITRTLNESWHFSTQNATMTSALRKGTCSDLNIFILNPQFGENICKKIDSFCSVRSLVY